MPSLRTEKAYRRAATRWNAELARCGLEPTPENYVVVGTADDPYLTDASWRFIRAAIKWWITSEIGHEEAERFTRLFREKKPAVKPKLKLPKGVGPQLEQDLIHVLRNGNRGRFQLLAADMIEAGIATGLRPVEWKDASLVDDVLTVPNAKYRPGVSGNGEKRELFLLDDVITFEQRSAIDRVITALNGVEWDDIGTHVRRALRGAKAELRKMKLITPKEMKTRIYDARHQFAANAKNTLDYQGGEVAAAMGHRSAVTAHTSYGNRRKGRVGLPVKPSAVSVENVDKRSLAKLAGSIAKAVNQSVNIAQPKASDNGASNQTTNNEMSTAKVRATPSQTSGFKP